MVDSGLTPPNVRYDQLNQHAATMGQLRRITWEQMQGLMHYRDVLANGAQQQQQYEAQMQPLRLQEGQQAVQRGQEAGANDSPRNERLRFESTGSAGRLWQDSMRDTQLTSADFAALKDLSAAGQTKIFDYGLDGSGPGKGQWLVSGKDYTPIKQLSPMSESGRATALQKQQFARQNALLKGMQFSGLCLRSNREADRAYHDGRCTERRNAGDPWSKGNGYQERHARHSRAE